MTPTFFSGFLAALAANAAGGAVDDGARQRHPAPGPAAAQICQTTECSAAARARIRHMQAQQARAKRTATPNQETLANLRAEKASLRAAVAGRDLTRRRAQVRTPTTR